MIEDRRKFIGGSDAPAILGLSRWKTQLRIWAEKTGQVEEEDISERINVKLGKKMEQTVAEFFMEETGKKVQRVNETLIHPKYPFLGANIDRRVIGEKTGLECKTATIWKYKEWEGEDIPTEYIVQCMHYLAVTGLDKWYIACLIGNSKFVWKEIKRDEKVLSDIIDKEVKFWNKFIIPKVMPAQISAMDNDILYQLYSPAQEGSEIELDDEAEKVIENIDSLEVDQKSLKGQIEQQKNVLKSLLKENETGLTNNHKVSWKNQSNKRLNTTLLKEENPAMYEQYSKVTESRVLRISDRKDKEE